MYSTSSHCTAEALIINFHQCTTDLSFYILLKIITAHAVKSILKVLLQSVPFRIGYTKCMMAHQLCEDLKQSLPVEKLLQTIRNNTLWPVNIRDQTTILRYYLQDFLSLISDTRSL